MTEDQPTTPDPANPPAAADPQESEVHPAAQASSSATANALRSVAGRICAEIGKAVVGQEDVTRQMVATFLAGGHLLLEGVPGLGKTLLALALARTFGGRFARVQFTPDLMPADLTGHSVYDPNQGTFHLRRGPIFTHLLLADEINRAPAKTQSALLEVMQEQQVTVDGESLALAGPFLCIATQNSLEHEGTYPLPEAQLDRFLIKALIEYPTDLAEETALVERVTRGQMGDRLDVAAVNQVLTVEQTLELQRLTASLVVDRRIFTYAVEIVRLTRGFRGVRVGAGPRAAIALIRLARAFAVLADRDFVIPDDIKLAAAPVLRHRLALEADQSIGGVTNDQMIRAIVDRVEAPRQ